MKRLFILCTLISLAISSNSQTNIKNSNIVYTSPFEHLAFTPIEQIVKIDYSSKKWVDGKQGLQFSFLLSPEKEMPILNMDSIFLTSTDFHTLILNKKMMDTTEYFIDLKIAYNGIYRLEDNDVKFLKEMSIEQVTVFINKTPIVLKLTKKTQKEFNQFFRTNF